MAFSKAGLIWGGVLVIAVVSLPMVRFLHSAGSVSESSSSIAARQKPGEEMSAELGTSIWQDVSGPDVEALLKAAAAKPDAGEKVRRELAMIWTEFTERSKALGYSDYGRMRALFLRGASPYILTAEGRKNFLTNWAGGVRLRDADAVKST